MHNSLFQNFIILEKSLELILRVLSRMILHYLKPFSQIFIFVLKLKYLSILVIN